MKERKRCFAKKFCIVEESFSVFQVDGTIRNLGFVRLLLSCFIQITQPVLLLFYLCAAIHQHPFLYLNIKLSRIKLLIFYPIVYYVFFSCLLPLAIAGIVIAHSNIELAISLSGNFFYTTSIILHPVYRSFRCHLIFISFALTSKIVVTASDK